MAGKYASLQGVSCKGLVANFPKGDLSLCSGSFSMIHIDLGILLLLLAQAFGFLLSSVKKTEEEVFTFPFHFLNLFWKSETKFPMLMKFLREAHLFSIYQQQVDLKYHLVSR